VIKKRKNMELMPNGFSSGELSQCVSPHPFHSITLATKRKERQMPPSTKSNSRKATSIGKP